MQNFPGTKTKIVWNTGKGETQWFSKNCSTMFFVTSVLLKLDVCDLLFAETPAKASAMMFDSSNAA
jgi:hypothetical protein